MTGRMLSGWFFVLLLGQFGPAAAEVPATVEFNRDVRPILSDNCFFCHGPDKNKRQADLRLDTEAGLRGEGAEAALVHPGQPDESPLWQRIAATDPDERMPPADSGKALDEHELEILRRWIEQGANWEGHWAFQPIERVTPPEVPDSTSPIDDLLAAARQAQNLEPAAAAAPHALARRLSLDLTGLPPESGEVAQFVADPSAAAYERLVERYLSSPEFGERMAVWWLDLVRYADSVGYHGDQAVSVFPFRQYVIESFNANKPFDQFTLEQLAGDLLLQPTLEQQIASGYNRLGMMSAEGGVQDKEYLAKYAAERVRNLGGTWLGLTVGCAECHDHKFDPVSTRDFYRLEAFFADLEERGLYSGANVNGEWGPRIAVPTAEQTVALATLDQALAATKAELETSTPELEAAQVAWEAARVPWLIVRPSAASSAGGAELKILDDGSVLAGGTNPAQDVYTITLADPPAGVTAFRLEVLPHDSLPQRGPGRAENGNFVLSEFAWSFRAGPNSEFEPVKLDRAVADHTQTTSAEGNPYGRWTPVAAIDGDARGPGWGWAILDAVGREHQAVFQSSGDAPGGAGSEWRLTLAQNLPTAGHNLGRFRLAVTTAPRPVEVDEVLPDRPAAILATPPAVRAEAQRRELAAYFRSRSPLLEAARVRLAELEKQRASLVAQIPTTLVARTVPPRMIRVLARGNWMDESGAVVEPGFPEFLAGVVPPPGAGAGAALASADADGAAAAATSTRLTRLDLARWLVAPEHPLVARVVVNRIWKLLFGAGLSRRVDDLGSQGEWPTQPELLDYLAGRLIDSGWDLKGLIRAIVSSEAYRQSSVASDAALAADPENRWWTRQSRFRLDAEFVRDQALAVSGLLVRAVGGASVRPYQPAGYWAYLNFPAREWQNDAGQALYRRGLYTHWQRQYLHPSLLAFDAPSREECTADRPRSNTPLQSLVLLNDPSYVEAARALAERMLREGGTDPAGRLDWAFRRAVARPIEPSEAEVLVALVDKHRRELASDPAAVEALLAVGAHPAPADLDRVELAAWTSAARAILNLHETVTRN